jgi:TRAP-type mannitol/chloroaromatic compound transport system substrate-binding protein
LIADRAELIQALKADSETIRPFQTDAIKSSLVRTRSRLRIKSSRKSNASGANRHDGRAPAGGTQLRPFSQEIMEACYKAANEVYAETAAANPRFKKIYDNYVAFRNDSYLWWQVAEMSFDMFQVRMRNKA